MSRSRCRLRYRGSGTPAPSAAVFSPQARSAAEPGRTPLLLGDPALPEELQEPHKQELSVTWHPLPPATPRGSPRGAASRPGGPGAAASVPRGAGRVSAGPSGPGSGAGAGPGGAATRGPRARPTWVGAERRSRFARSRLACPPAWQPPTGCFSTFPSPGPPSPGRSPDPVRPWLGGKQRPPKEDTTSPARLPQRNGGAKHPVSQPRKLPLKRLKGLFRERH